MNMKNTRGIGCVLVVIALIAGAFLLFGGLGGGSDIPQTGGNQLPGASASEGRLGQPYVAREVSRSGCPVDSTNDFYYDEVIYAGYDESLIPDGTEIFARLSYEGDPVEDAPAVTADQDLRTCVWFEFQPGREGFYPGNYTVDLFVNGNRSETLAFEVVDDSSAAAANQPSYQNVQLGQVTTTSQVDRSGCPVDRLYSFYPDESVFVAAEQSFIPAGTEVFARLTYEGDVVEETAPIVADQDLQSCVWFEFEPTSSQGFYPGNYTAQLYVNGSLADEVVFSVE